MLSIGGTHHVTGEDFILWIVSDKNCFFLTHFSCLVYESILDGSWKGQPQPVEQQSVRLEAARLQTAEEAAVGGILETELLHEAADRVPVCCWSRRESAGGRATTAVSSMVNVRASFVELGSSSGRLRLKRLKGVGILLLFIFAKESIEGHEDNTSWAGAG